MKIKIFLRTIITYILILIYSIIYITPCIIIALLPLKYRNNNRLFYKLLDKFFKGVIKSSFLDINIKGKNNIINPSIIVANHQSSFDIPLVGSILNGYPHIWLAMSYYINKPFLGLFIKRMFVPVDQSSKRSSSSSILRIIHILKNNQKSFIIFPEGGRFIDGNIHKFYDGFAIVAQKTGLPVIPVYIANNRKIYPPYTFYIYNYPIKLIIGKAQYFQKDDTIETFKERIYKWFIKENSKDKISKNGD